MRVLRRGRACLHSTCFGGFRVQIRAHTNNGDMTKIRFRRGGDELIKTPATSNNIKRYTIAAGCPAAVAAVGPHKQPQRHFILPFASTALAVWRPCPSVLTLRSGIRRRHPKQIASIINRLSLSHARCPPRKNRIASNMHRAAVGLQRTAPHTNIPKTGGTNGNQHRNDSGARVRTFFCALAQCIPGAFVRLNSLVRSGPVGGT